MEHPVTATMQLRLWVGPPEREGQPERENRRDKERRSKREKAKRRKVELLPVSSCPR
jgi:hypothetical protein